MLLFCLTSYAKVWGKPRMFWATVNTDALRRAVPLWRDEIGPKAPHWDKTNWQAIHLVEAPPKSNLLFTRMLNGEQWKQGYKLMRVWNGDAIWDAFLEEKLTAKLVERASRAVAAKLKEKRMFGSYGTDEE